MKRPFALLLLLFLMACGTGTASPPPIPEVVPVSTASPTASATPAPIPADNLAVIGYFPDYRTLNPEWAKHLTDIVYFSAEPRGDGTLDTSRFTKETLDELNILKKQYGLRIHISIGGWERSSGFAAMASDSKGRSRFIGNLTSYLLENDLDGADFDWEFPEDDSQLKNYIALLTETKAAFVPLRLTVSVALSPDFKDSLGEFAVVDRIHIMSYDRGARHSTYEQAVADLQVYLEAGIPREKLILGVPFYGREENPPNDAFSYAEIRERYNPPPSADEVAGIYFNGIETIQRKTCLAINSHIGGVMIWELAQDTTDETSLLLAIERTKLNGCAP